MKKAFLFLGVSITMILAACGDTKESTEDKEVSDANVSTEVSATETVNAEDSDQKDETEKTENKSEDKADGTSSKALPQGENLLKEDSVFEYEDGDIVMTINHAEFTKEFASSTGDDKRSIISDKEIYLHLSGTISNDTLDSFSYGHQLGSVKFKAIYDNKHEFDFLATTESLDGSKLEGASIDSLQEQNFHLYSQVPLPVSERDNSLVLVVIDSEGEHEIVLR
ncbi:hypothetical protein [Bacillus sp. Cr_A10]|uniref:hypothetical protein n=1 Tax=Bacillus sp. Cr_A10 TaxID=3033993 RepID=UPI0023DA5B4C|nr:hypothetical protein [Bacillus sp. Cr_A10]MDF2065530.1 hypothetical protein [Bacillus sp. Cr_A10]